MHVPKSGGTTLDCILRDHFHDTPLYPPVGPNKLGQVLEQLNDPTRRYVGGHYPVGTVHLDAFECKLTIVRDPVDLIGSRLSFKNRLANAPPETLSPPETEGRQMHIYERYYSPHFDVDRCTLDSKLGVFHGVQHYVAPSALHEVIEQLEKFDYVLDFANLDAGIKCFLIRNEGFPYRRINKKRAYGYTPDRERAKNLLCEFDQHFYESARQYLIRLPSNIESQYEQYRADYCESRGLSLQVHDGQRLDLRGPIGSGWFNVETSDKGTPFRWSEDQHATIEVPVAHAGLYGVHVYVTSSEVDDVRLTARTTQEPRTFPVTEVNTGGLRVFTALVATRSHDWIQIDLELSGRSENRTPSRQGDVRALGVALGDVRVVRHPA